MCIIHTLISLLVNSIAFSTFIVYRNYEHFVMDTCYMIGSKGLN